jgi:hypothetical protein
VQTVHAYAAVRYAAVDDRPRAGFVSRGGHPHLLTEGVIIKCR